MLAAAELAAELAAERGLRWPLHWKPEFLRRMTSEPLQGRVCVRPQPDSSLDKNPVRTFRSRTNRTNIVAVKQAFHSLNKN